MELTIRKLTPALAEDYTRFFDHTPHNDSNGNTKCYCVTFCRDAAYHAGGAHWYPTAAERRQHGLQRVQSGDIQGYLAYADGQPVGWCNTNTKAHCREVISYMRSVGIPVEESPDGEKALFVFCFAIAPLMQRQGVATQLLTHVCQEAAAAGFDFIEAQTHTGFVSDGFRGPLALYEKCGFVILAHNGDKVVVRKALQP